tara:strand:+ start:50 stop:628 length:579 start_codon:yes stop_codon:yes gene_type:complete
MVRDTKYYVYQHRLEDGKVFYVGRGSGKRAFNTTNRNHLWKQLVKENKSFIVEIKQDNLTEEQAKELEIKTIKELGLENLTNLTDESLGGDIRKYLTDEQYEKWIERKSQSAMGNIGYYTGKKRPNHAKKLKQAHKDGRYSYEHLRKPKSDETKKKISESKKGLTFKKKHCKLCDRSISVNNFNRHICRKRD